MTEQLPLLFMRPQPETRPVRRNLVIEAGAGTGKTTAIVAEVLKLLLWNEDLPPERIVLVTFTEKAAGEIADRIHHALAEIETASGHAGPLRWPAGSPDPLLVIPAEDRDRCLRACARHLAQIDSLRSQTIHSFCQSLLREFPIEAELDPHFKIVEGFERTLLHEELYDAWIDEETRTRPTPQSLAEWEALLAHAGYLFLIRDMIFALVERRDLLLEASSYDLGDLRDVADDLRKAIQLVKACRVDDAAPPICRYIRSTPAPREGAPIDDWIEYFAPIAHEIRSAKLPRGKGTEQLNAGLKILRGGDIGNSMYDALVSHRAAMALLSLAARFVEFLEREKRTLGVVDFDDLLLRTLKVLENPAVLERARSRFDFIFVDEFQDTDRTQARILDLLARDRGGRYVDGKLVVVGDPKQSIYGFRRADPETYYRMTRRMIDAGADERPIEVQYRSERTLLDAINAMFARVFPETPHDPNVFKPVYRPLRSGAPTSSSAPAGAPLSFLHAAHADPADRYLAEAEAIAQWILSRGGDLRQYAILFRRLTVIDDYLETFRRHGIDVVLPPTRLFLDRPAPVDLLTVLRAVAYPFDKGAEISAARTPYFALTDEEIAAGILDYGSPDAVAAWSHFKVAIGAFRDASPHLTISQLIDRILETTGIESVYNAAAEGDRSKLHLEHVRRIAFDYDQRAAGSVRQFVDEISRRRTEPDEVEPSLIDESRNAVRILTVHAAKGLEFETVILPDLGFANPGADGVQIFTVEEPRSMVLTGTAQSLSAEFRFLGSGDKLRKIASAREEAETRRLFYVAVTRAKKEVVFVCNTAAFRKSGFYGCVADLFGFDKDNIESFWNGDVHEISGIPVTFERPSGERASRPLQGRRRLTDGSLENELRTGPIVPPDIVTPHEVPTLSRTEIAIGRERARSRRAGILLHRFLERWNGSDDAGALLEQLAAEQGADAKTLDRVRQRIETVRRSPMFARIARAETIGRELTIRFAGENGRTAERRLDRLIRENGRDVVVDYKSGSPDEARVTADREQVQAYARAISAMTGRPCEGILWYIDLEHDEVIA